MTKYSPRRIICINLVYVHISQFNIEKCQKNHTYLRIKRNTIANTTRIIHPHLFIRQGLILKVMTSHLHKPPSIESTCVIYDSSDSRLNFKDTLFSIRPEIKPVIKNLRVLSAMCPRSDLELSPFLCNTVNLL